MPLLESIVCCLILSLSLILLKNNFKNIKKVTGYYIIICFCYGAGLGFAQAYFSNFYPSNPYYGKIVFALANVFIIIASAIFTLGFNYFYKSKNNRELNITEK